MSVSVFCEVLSNWGADRAAKLTADDVVKEVFCYLGPDNTAAQSNANELKVFRPKLEQAGGQLWGWWVNSADQTRDLAEIELLHARHKPVGWVLDIESPLKYAALAPILEGVRALGVPVIASVAGSSSSHAPYDFRGLDKRTVPVDWQCYMDSGEGPPPGPGVREMFKASFVVGGWEYRIRVGDRYGWGKIGPIQGSRATVDSYMTPGATNFELNVRPREWGHLVVDRALYRTGSSEKVGELMGRVAYPNIRATLDTTRGAAAKHTPAEWTSIAASAKATGASKRPISVYLGEHTPDDVMRAIARGAA